MTFLQARLLNSSTEYLKSQWIVYQEVDLVKKRIQKYESLFRLGI